jgi:hypothetical protein
MNTNKASGEYEVLSPWADVDPKPLRSIAPRITDLAEKKIGFFYNAKEPAYPITRIVADRLKARFPTCETSWYPFTRVSIPEIEANKEKFESWLNGLDAVILAVAD